MLQRSENSIQAPFIADFLTFDKKYAGCKTILPIDTHVIKHSFQKQHFHETHLD